MKKITLNYSDEQKERMDQIKKDFEQIEYNFLNARYTYDNYELDKKHNEDYMKKMKSKNEELREILDNPISVTINDITYPKQ